MRLFRTKNRVRFAFGLSVVFCVLLGYLFFTRSPAPRTPQVSILQSEQSNARFTALQQDDDNDGLKNWEEVLFRTDPHNPDTDGDGTNDNQEVAQARSPLKSGPNDILATITERIEASEEGDVGPKNYTKLLAETFGQQFIIPYIQQQGSSVDPKLFGQALTEKILSTASEDVPVTFYTAKDIHTHSDNSAAAWQRYAEEVDTLVVNSFGNLLSTLEIEIFSRAIEQENYKELALLDPYLTALDRTITGLKKIKTPSDLADIHLEYLNLTARQEFGVQKMRDAEKDMVGAFIGMQEYSKAIKKFDELLVRIRQEFTKRHIAL